MSEKQIIDAGYPTAETDSEAGVTVPFSEARAMFTTLVNQAADEGQRVVVTKFGRPVAAVVPIFDLKRLMDSDAAVRARMQIDQTEGSGLVDIEEDTDDSQTAEGQLRMVGALVNELLEIPAVHTYVAETNVLIDEQSHKGGQSCTPETRSDRAADHVSGAGTVSAG